MNVWFGTGWGAPLCDETTQVPVPAGASCLWCDETIEADATGWGQTASGPWAHVECFMRQMLGSVGHQLRLCSCHGGDYEDPPTLTLREAAKAAWDQAQGLRDQPQQPYIVCPRCGSVSHHPQDISERYCGRCHRFHNEGQP